MPLTERGWWQVYILNFFFFFFFSFFDVSRIVIGVSDFVVVVVALRVGRGQGMEGALNHEASVLLIISIKLILNTFT